MSATFHSGAHYNSRYMYAATQQVSALSNGPEEGGLQFYSVCAVMRYGLHTAQTGKYQPMNGGKNCFVQYYIHEPPRITIIRRIEVDSRSAAFGHGRLSIQ